MRRRKLIGIFAVVLIVAALGLALLISRSAPATSTVQIAGHTCLSSAQSCLVFPTVTGDNLLGQSFTLPAGFVGQFVLVILPFDEKQQVTAQTWLAPARDLAAAHPGFAYYNVPVFPSMAAPMRTLIRAGMTLSIPDPQLRTLTITVFLDQRDQFLAELNIPNVDAMQVFLLNPSREVIWRGAGDFTSVQGDAVRALLTA